MAAYEKLPLLDPYDSAADSDGFEARLAHQEALLRPRVVRRSAGGRPPRRRGSWVVHGLAASINVLLFSLLVITGCLYNRHPGGLPAPYSPAAHVISYENTAFNYSLFQTNKYNGDPRPEQAQAWSHLMGHMGLWATDDEMHKLNRTSIKVPGQGNLIELEMFHQLHCLDYLRQYIYSAYYPIHESSATVRIHVSHCIDALRQAIQCHGDTAIVTYSWRPDYNRPWPDFQLNKQCRNYRALRNWAMSRKVTNKFEKNPVYDPQFDGTSPPGRPNGTELVQGTRLNPKLLEELQYTQAYIY